MSYNFPIEICDVTLSTLTGNKLVIENIATAKLAK
jgi:hypothetical protein